MYSNPDSIEIHRGITGDIHRFSTLQDQGDVRIHSHELEVIPLSKILALIPISLSPMDQILGNSHQKSAPRTAHPHNRQTDVRSTEHAGCIDDLG